MARWGVLLLSAVATLSWAEPVVVVSANSPLQHLNQQEVRLIFNGHSRRIGDLILQPLDLPQYSDDRDHFYQLVLGKNPEQMKSYWARMIFTGRGMPPREVSGEREMLMLLDSHDNYIGYLDRSYLTPQLKMVYQP